MRPPKGMLLAALAAVFLTTGQTHAQEDRESLTADEVRSFVENAEQDAIELVRTGDYSSLLDWVEGNIADDVTFFVSQEVHVGDHRKGFAVMSLDKQDVLRLSQIAVKMMSGMPQDSLEDYSLDMEVTEINPIGPNAATAKTRIVESGRFLLSGGTANDATEPAGTEQAPAARVEVEATSECSHLVRRGQSGDHLLLDMTTCHVDIRL